MTASDGLVHDFCVQRMGMSEDEACRRVHGGSSSITSSHALVAARIRERRHPRQRGSVSESCALSGERPRGTSSCRCRRALDAVSARHGAEVLTTIPVQTMLREALAVLM
jgi:hypothetical protein